MWNLLRHLSALLIWCTCAASAMADGGAFKRLVEDPTAANMPDQRAILAYSNGIETLAIQTRFEGNPAEFAWVVPLPAVPKVTACTHGTFKTMPSLMARRVQANEPAIWKGALLFVVAMMVMYHNRSRVADVLICLLLLMGGAVILLPTLSLAGSGGTITCESKVVVKSEEVGNYEVTILSSKSADELVTWLTEHGFAVSDKARDAIAAYARDGWVFAASRASRSKVEAGGGTITPHALTFEFKTSVPIYPMRLTGANNTGPLEVSLYVFGSGTAESPGWTLKYSDECDVPRVDGRERYYPRPWPHSQVVVTHAGVRSLLASHADSPMHATHLTRVFQPEDMSTDVVLRFGAPVQFQEVIWSPEAAFNAAANLGVLVMIACWLIAIGVKALLPVVRTDLVWTMCLGVPILVTSLLYIRTPKADALRSLPREWVRAAQLSARAYSLTGDPDVGPPSPGGTGLLPFETARERVSSWIDELYDPKDPTRPIMEDSPGNYMLESSESRWVLRIFDLTGQETRIPL